MSECEREAEALPQPLMHEGSAYRQELDVEIAHIQRKARCAQRAAGMMALMTALGAAGLVYPAIMLDSLPWYVPNFIINLAYALGVGSLISLLAFAALASLYRKKLRQRKETCRQMTASVFGPPLGQVDNTSLRILPASSVVARDNDGIV
jgi:hypothetical protein